MPFQHTSTRSLYEVLCRLVAERRTYSASQARVITYGLLSFVTFVAMMLVLHASVFTVPAQIYYHRQQDAYLQRLMQHHRAPPHTRAPSHTKYTFAQHPDAELGALINFLAALPSNALPESVNPHAHIDPELILDFAPHSADDAEVDALVAGAWARNPVVIFSELHAPAAPASREMKGVFAALTLRPGVTVFELDQRVDADVLRPLLQRLTRGAQLPFALVGGRTLTLTELRTEVKSGALTDRVARAGAVINGAKLRRRVY